MQDWWNKFARIGSAMTMVAKVQMQSLMNIMWTCWWKELNVIERSTYNCSQPIWKPSFHAMVTKVSWIVSWVPMHLLPWMLHKRWIFIRSIECVHMYQKIPTIEGWGNPSNVRNVVKKLGKIIKRLERLIKL